MKIGVIVAMRKELDLLLSLFDNVEKVDGFFFGRIGDREIVAMQCGIGKVNAALGADTLIRRFKPDVMINTGVAGGTGRDASILDVVVASHVAYHDVWCGPGTEWGEASGCPRLFRCAEVDIPGTKRGLVASGDIFVSRVEEVEKILGLYPEAVAVDMESAAIAQVCFLNNIPLYCLKVVSDTPGQADNIAQYDNFWEDAPRSTFVALEHIISAL